MEEDFESLTQGVFVVPFQPQTDGDAKTEPLSGPSSLGPVYDEAWRRYHAIAEAQAIIQKEEQLDIVEEWLERAKQPTLLASTSTARRLPMAIMKNTSSSPLSSLSGREYQSHTINGRSISDLTSALLDVAVGFMGETANAAKKSGRAVLDEVDRWFQGRKQSPLLFLQIENAQMVNPNTLSELIYVLSRHNQLPIHVLLLVPSISTFMPTLIHIEPTSLDISVLKGRNERKAGADVKALLQSIQDPKKTPVLSSQELAEVFRQHDATTGNGRASILKALKWLLLQKRATTSLRTAPEEALTLDASEELNSILDPAPRISTLHSLRNRQVVSSSAAAAGSEPGSGEVSGSVSRKRTRDSETDKGKGPAGPANPIPELVGTGETLLPRGELADLESLFALWTSAGRTINLWDWLEGYNGALARRLQAQEDEGAEEDGDLEEPETPSKKRRRKGVSSADTPDETGGASEEAPDETIELSNEVAQGKRKPPQDVNEPEEDRTHASFIRFCEEARMIGLVRARGHGRGRRADEIVKSIGIV